MEIVKTQKCFGGKIHYVEHESAVLNCRMRLSVYIPPQQGPRPMVTWLSGLTCTEENFTSKAGAYKKASELGLIVVAPDTSPRGEGVANADGYDLGQGAGFYVNSTEEPWKSHFQMYSYISEELQELLKAHFSPDMNRQAIMGHSMGGHGAITIGLKKSSVFKSISAFSPIVSPSTVPWGRKAFLAYLGENEEAWKNYDSCELVKQFGAPEATPILIDQGLADDFLEKELQPHKFQEACESVGQKLELRMQEGYDHSYFFISSFIDDHLEFHAKNLG